MVDKPENENFDAERAAGEGSVTGEELAGELERLKVELEQAHDRVLRLGAEMENLRRRTRREIDDERRYANLPLMQDLLPVMDNITRAIDAAEQKHDVESLLEGVKLVAQQLQSVLANQHCQPIDALHQPFDPNRHQAIMQQPSADHPAGTVLAVTQSGYQLHERVIRPAQVIVSSPSAGDGQLADRGST